MSCWICRDTKKVTIWENYLHPVTKTEQFILNDTGCPVCASTYLKFFSIKGQPCLEAIDGHDDNS